LIDLATLLADYGGYHRDPRNRLTHYVGVPLIIYSVLVALALVSWEIFAIRLGLDRLIVAGLAVFYVCLDVRLGLCLAVALALLAVAAELTGALGSSVALTVGGAGFIIGWAAQLLGHRFEGNRPALLDNVLQIFIAPIYLAAELGFALGLRSALRSDIEQRLPHG